MWKRVVWLCVLWPATALAQGAPAPLGANDPTRALPPPPSASSTLDTARPAEGAPASANGEERFVLSEVADTLGKANDYTDSEIGKVRQDMRTLSRKSFAGISAAVAMGQAPMPSAVGKTDLAVHTGLFENYTGVGVAFSHRLNTDAPLAIDGGFAHAGSENIGRVGFSVEF